MVQLVKRLEGYWKDKIMKELNLHKLNKELIAAGIATTGNTSSGIVWDLENNEIQDTKAVKAVIAAHDPAEETVATLEEKIEALEAKLVGYDIMKSDIALLKGTITLTDK